MRIYWACTHVTLRETEIPLLLDAGLEVIPEEPSESILTPQELKSYECPKEHEINNMWQNRCSIDEKPLGIMRRAHLSTRKGQISEFEKTLFNLWIDVIYVATDLKTACEVASWFDGIIVFRQFGINDILGDFRQQVDKMDPEILKKIILCPIFDSITELEECQRFGGIHVIHGTRDIIPHLEWQGYEESEHYAVVAHNVKQATHAADTVDKLSPFARSYITWLYGKNQISHVPLVIRQAFLVSGYQTRKDYYKNLARRRLLLYPFDNPYHNHYTNIEAVASSIPTLTMALNPLARENGVHKLSPQERKEIGVCESIDEMTSWAVKLYDDPDGLSRLVTNQKKLLYPFTSANVASEIKGFISFLKKRIHDRRASDKIVCPSKDIPAFLEHGFDKRLELRQYFAENGGNLPGSLFPGLCRHSDYGDKAIVYPAEPPIVVDLAAPGQRYVAGNHQFLFSVKGHDTIGICVEIWRDDKCVNRHYFYGSPDGQECLNCYVPLDKPANLIFHLASIGNDPIEIESVAHKITSKQDTGASNNENAMLHWLHPHIASAFTSVSPLITPNDEVNRYGLIIKQEETHQLILPPVLLEKDVEAELEMTLQVDARAKINLSFECWVNDKVSHRNKSDYKLEAGTNTILLKVGGAPDEFTPVIYIRSLSSDIYARELRVKGGRAANDNQSHQDVIDIPTFYGQFNPPVDKYLWENFFHTYDHPGIFVECGACDGVTDSSCLMFQKSFGWSGLNIEPTPYFYEKLKVNRPLDRNLNIALSNEEGTATFKHAIHPFWGRHFGNGSLTHQKEHLGELKGAGCEFEDIKVHTKRFADVLEDEDLPRLDLMVLDVEGHEMTVLEDLEEWKIKPKVFCVEFPQSGLENLRALIEKNGYTFYGTSYSNAFWVQPEMLPEDFIAPDHKQSKKQVLSRFLKWLRP